MPTFAPLGLLNAQSLMNYLEPGYTIPSRKYFTKLQHSSYKGQLQKQLHTEAESVALTTDIWTSHAVEAYITVTAHYLNSLWVMYSYVLETSAFSERHTGVEIAGKLKDIADRFEIGTKVSVVVHDQAANMVNSLDILESERDCEFKLYCTLFTTKSGFDIPVINRLLAAVRDISITA